MSLEPPAEVYEFDARAVARAIDHTLLRPEATPDQVERTIAEAGEHGFAAACIPPVYAARAAELLRGTEIRVCTVVGFPFGYVQPSVRLAEARRAVADGAQELDTVLNVSWLKGGEVKRLLDDLGGWVSALRGERRGLTLKVILETALLTEQEKIDAARLAVEAGADFIKTSTGVAAGAVAPNVADVKLLVWAAGGHAEVAASGRIADAAGARALLAAGATRLGTASGVAIVRELEDRG
jgi:deoxyribose-phosphate aldolase